ncbi:DNA polymerase III subunit epsilon [Porphyromonas sp. COT-108 OH2963]|uniref:3'-5' exonuclease n=1 Tax=Porphyromonas sp. COT-108 OH2963 TaxID=1515614 RepID=UPI00052C6F19|nr:3'-5' exonuclease [Porphyromonas sp. COT-108 OH2963]KGN94372.1 DNA polymerase III subunit epsilon [Porphyromonas sp. COT-108 OH2963]
MKLQLQRPLVFFDLETTGTDITKDRIVEISLHKVYPNGDTETKTRRINPEIPIPAEATAVHGISDEDVKDEPPFKSIAKDLARILENCDFGGYNCNRFDLPMLVEGFLRAEIPVDFSDRKVIDVQVIFHKKEQRTLAAAYEFYCNKELVDAHSAEADTIATYEVLLGQLDRYDDLQGDVDFLDEYTKQRRVVDYAGRLQWNDKDEKVIAFGKYRNQVAAEVLKRDPGYYDWILSSDFPRNTKLEFMKVYAEIHAPKK